MKILAIGSKPHFNLLQQKLGDQHDYTLVEDASLALNSFEGQDLVIDFFIDLYPDNFDAYKYIENLPVFLNTPKISLAELVYYNRDASCRLLGFNGLPGFFENIKWR